MFVIKKRRAFMSNGFNSLCNLLREREGGGWSQGMEVSEEWRKFEVVCGSEMELTKDIY